ncbi:hypothetical protein E2P81_ATG06047 [Venturia nashicola]|nr:hypothetical protein E2P81_ATG06047 [Venturia nashicola]
MGFLTRGIERGKTEIPLIEEKYYREENDFTRKPETYIGKKGWFTEAENGQWIAEQAKIKSAAIEKKAALDKAAAEKMAALDKAATLLVPRETIQNAAVTAGTPPRPRTIGKDQAREERNRWKYTSKEHFQRKNHRP